MILYVSMSVLEVDNQEGNVFVSLLPLKYALEKLNSPNITSDISFSEKTCLMILYEAVCSFPPLFPHTLCNWLLLLIFFLHSTKYHLMCHRFVYFLLVFLSVRCQKESKIKKKKMLVKNRENFPANAKVVWC